MSTRCQFAVFPDGWKAPKELVWGQVKENAVSIFYRHHDGYPEGAGAELKRHVADFIALRGYDDEYIGARVLQWMMNESDELLKQWNKGRRECLSYGVTKYHHGDIEFFYAITKDGVAGYEVSGEDGDKFTQIEI